MDEPQEEQRGQHLRDISREAPKTLEYFRELINNAATFSSIYTLDYTHIRTDPGGARNFNQTLKNILDTFPHAPNKATHTFQQV